jgi:hypothetical protein
METPSLDALKKFLVWAGGNGAVKPATASAMKSCVGRVLGLINPPPDDVFQIDLDAALRRFGNLNAEVSPGSLRTYQSRIQTALELFRRYRESGPHNFRPETRSGGQAQPSIKPLQRERHRVTPRSAGPSNSPTPATSPLADGLAYPFPLRAEVNVMLSNIPRDLKLAEAERIAAFLKSLCEDFKP